MTTITAHEQIIRRADSELQVIQKETAEALATIATIDAELATISTRMQARGTHFSTIFETASSLQAQYNAVFTQDQLSAGTLSEGQLSGQVKAALKEKNKAEKALSSFEAKMQKADADDQINLAALSAERETCTKRLAQGDTQRQSLEQARAAAFASIGVDEARDAIFQIDLLNRQLEVRKNAVHQAQQELDDFARETTARLAPWPEHLTEALALIPFSDDTTAVLAGCLQYVDTLIEHISATPDAIATFGFPGELQWTVYKELLMINPQSVYPSGARDLREQRRKLLTFLNAYRDKRGK